jgi:hypothetical protein
MQNNEENNHLQNDKFNININVSPEKENLSNPWLDIVKLLLTLLLGGLVGAWVTGFFNIKLEQEKRQTEILLRIFEVSKYSSNQKDSGKLDADAFADNLELLDLTKFYEKSLPVQEIREKAKQILDRTWTKAAQYEALGFQAVLNKDIVNAKDYFQKSYKAYDEYHYVDEINKFIGNKTQIQDWSKDIYCPILKEFSGGMPNEIKVQMSQKGNCKK